MKGHEMLNMRWVIFSSSQIPDKYKATCFHPRKQLDVKMRVCACQQWWKTAGLFCVLWALLPFTSDWTSTYIDRTLSIRPDSLSCDKKYNFLITENGNTWRIQTKEFHWHVMSGECEGCLSVSGGSRYKTNSQSSHSRLDSVWLATCSVQNFYYMNYYMNFLLCVVLLFISVFISTIFYYY